MTLIVRKASDADAAAIAAIYRPYVEATAITFEEIAPSAEQLRERMAGIYRTHPWLVAEADEGVVGYAYSSRHRDRASYRWSVDVSVYINGAWHRRGVGRALYATLLALLSRQGFAHAYAGITLPNPSSVALHETMGFERIGVYPGVGFKRGAWRDVGWWGRVLAPSTHAPSEPLPLDQVAASAWQSCLDAGMRYLRR